MARNNLQGFIALAGLSATSLYAAQPPIASSVHSDVYYNTAMGLAALGSDTPPTSPCVPFAFNNTTYYMSGCANTASGVAALEFNTSGHANTATGAGAMRENTSGAYNTAVGTLALYSSTSGKGNAALGSAALFTSMTGSYNLAAGAYSLFGNTTGTSNAAAGAYALFNNTSGSYNTAVGSNALHGNSAGFGNTASGAYALNGVTVGANNTALGAFAGTGSTATGTSSLTTGNYNTYIGYNVTGAATENYVTRIGVSTLDTNVPGTPTTYIAGIYNNALSGQAVVVTSTGQLGVTGPSSERFKTDIATMDGNASRLQQLRPVTFKYRTDPQGTVQYGLIAEEVATVYPELVIRDEHGRIDGVRYDELSPLLLNELQKQQAVIAAQAEHAAAQDAEISQLKAQLAVIQAAVAQFGTVDQRVANR